jgi:hypothetical protein
MAQDIRQPDTADLVKLRDEIRVEALRQMESCLYTSTSIYAWLKTVRWQHKAVVLLPILLSAAAGFSYLKDLIPAWALAILTLLATLIPSIAKALDIETHVQELKRAASEFKSLQDRFRQLALVNYHGDVKELEAKLSALMDKLDTARAISITPPDRYFQRARRKIKAGDYDFSVDMDLRKSVSEDGVTPLKQYT